MTRFVASLFVFVALSPILVAQRDPSQNCDLQVRIRTLGERIIETPVQVQLLEPQGRLATVSLVGDGSARFRVTSGRTYRLTVSGTGYQSVTTAYFEVEPLEQEHTETVHLVPLTSPPGTAAPTGQTMISVSELNIPKNAGDEMKKGLEAYSKANMEVAAEHFEKATAEYPQFARAYDLLGAIAIKNSNRSKARELISKSIEVDSTYVPAYVDLARMDVQDHRYAEAESLLQKAISFNPSVPEALALLATTEFVNKEYDKALADVQRTHTVRDHEQFAEVHLMAAKVLRMQNHREAAIEQYQLFIKEKPGSPEAQSARKALASLESEKP